MKKYSISKADARKTQFYTDICGAKPKLLYIKHSKCAKNKEAYQVLISSHVKS